VGGDAAAATSGRARHHRGGTDSSDDAAGGAHRSDTADAGPARATDGGARTGHHHGGDDAVAAGHPGDTAAAGDDTGSGHHRHAATPPPPVHPARIWVQVGIGRSDDRVAHDWKRMAADDPRLFKGRSPAVSAWGRTRRVLVGPFDSEAEAAAYAVKAKKAGHDDAFVWHSPAGQAVDPVATD
jgi:hypothetical protein